MIDRIYRLSARQDETGGPVRAEISDADSSLRNSGCRHLLILVHGFNNSTEAAEKSYTDLVANLQEHFAQSRVAPDAIAFFHWPGDVGGWASVGGYPYDITQARESAEKLADYLKSFPRATNPGALKINLIAHSLGCRLILEMLVRELPTALSLNIDVVSLMAPAVPTKLVDTANRLSAAVQPPRRTLKCFSKQDGVLYYAFPQGQRAAYALGTEDEFYDEAIGLNGNPELVGISVETQNGHSDYWSDADLANRFSATIDAAFRLLPAARRLPERPLPGNPNSDGRRLPGN